MTKDGEIIKNKVEKEQSECCQSEGKAKQEDPNPYSISNIKLKPQPKVVKKSRNEYKVKSVEELKNQNYIKVMNETKKLQKFSMNRLKYQNGPKMINYLEHFKE